MPLLFMETTCDPNSSDSVSTEDTPSAEGDRETEGLPKHKRGTKRRQRNRDAARKSRKKQTQRADELHEELQGLEHANSALEKEIKALQKELELYTTALEHHESLCCLKNRKPTVDSSTNSSPTTTTAPPKTPCFFMTPVPLISTSSKSSLGLHTTFSSPPELFPTTFSPAPYSLFSKKPNPNNTTPGCTSLLLPTTTTTNVQAHTGLKGMEMATYHSNSSGCVTSPTTYSTSTNAGVSYANCPPCSSLLSNPHDLPLFTQVHTESYPSLTFDLKPAEHPPNAQVDSLLPSLLTAPSHIDWPQSTSGKLPDVPFTPQPLLGDSFRDLSLMEFLEDNDWVLSGQ